ncbi:hypothetical protein D3C71_1288670 [compost metagenome]
MPTQSMLLWDMSKVKGIWNILTHSVLIISPTSYLNYHKVDPLRQIILIQVIVLIIRDRVSLAG